MKVAFQGPIISMSIIGGLSVGHWQRNGNLHCFTVKRNVSSNLVSYAYRIMLL